MADHLSTPGWIHGTFRTLSAEALETNLTIITGRLRKILEVPPSDLDTVEIYRLSNALSGLVKSGCVLENKEQERAQIIEQVRAEFIVLTRSQFMQYPELAKQIEEIIAGVQVKE